MGRKPRHQAAAKTSDSEEYRRFLETAREVEAEEDAKAFERALKRVLPTKRQPKESGREG